MRWLGDHSQPGDRDGKREGIEDHDPLKQYRQREQEDWKERGTKKDKKVGVIVSYNYSRSTPSTHLL